MTRAESYVEELREYLGRVKEVEALLTPDELGGSNRHLLAIELLLIDLRGDARLLMTK